MSINLDVVIKTPDQSVDMKAGLESLQGASDATRTIVETVLTEEVPKRLSSKAKVRTNLKKSFTGSYGHEFSLDIYDGELISKFKKIGSAVFSEIITYFINESLYLKPANISGMAKEVINNLGDTADDLVSQLRVSALDKIHQISIKFNYDLEMRFRKTNYDRITIAKFNRTTAEALLAKHTEERIDLTVSITRLNINTGNGRLLVEGEEETVAFGFFQYRKLQIKVKKVFSENLNYNNGRESKDYQHIRIVASPIKLRDGTIIKYVVRDFGRDK